MIHFGLVWLACSASEPELSVGVHAERRGDFVVLSVMNGDSTPVEGLHRLPGLQVRPGTIAKVEEEQLMATVYVAAVPPGTESLEIEGALSVSTTDGDRVAALPSRVHLWGSPRR